MNSTGGQCSYEWLDPADYRVAEVRLLDDVATLAEVGSRRAADNLLIRGDALNALRSLAHLPEFAGQYLRRRDPWPGGPRLFRACRGGSRAARARRNLHSGESRADARAPGGLPAADIRGGSPLPGRHSRGDHG